MKDKDKLEIYERNQCKLIKALTEKIKENKKLKKDNIYCMALCLYYGIFLTEKQIEAAHIMADAAVKKVT